MADSKAKILCVDDEPKNLKLLEALLLPKGYEIVLAENGEEALNKTLSELPDLILLDVMMPDISGYQVLEKLRADERTWLIPVVFITSLRETEDRIKGIEAGCDDFISKPFDKQEVFARVKTLLKISYYRSLLDEKEKFEYVMNHVNDGIMVLDGDFHMIHANQMAWKFFSMDRLDPDGDFIGHIQKTYQVCYEGNLGEDLKSRSLSFDLKRPGTEANRPLILAVRSSVIRNPSQEVSSYVLVINDVTEQRTEEYHKEAFLNVISHKLRTPLATIKGSAATLREGLAGPIEEQQKKMLDIIVHRSSAFYGMVEKLIGFSTLESRELKLPKEPVDLKGCLSEVIDTWKKSQENKLIEFDLDCQDSLAKINVDELYVDMIAGNLIENAIKFNEQDVIKISIRVRSSSGRIEISFTDNGLGVPPEEREKIFEKFYQIDKWGTGQIEGFGLGLTIVKHIVTLLGGEIQLESQVGQGSTFVINLPG